MTVILLEKAVISIALFPTLAQTAIPFVVILLAGFVAVGHASVQKAQPFVAVFAAGVLLACLAIHLLPLLHLKADPWGIALSLLLSWVLMTTLKKFHPGCCKTKTEQQSPIPVLVFGFGFEFFINGILIVLATLAGHLAALAVAISLALCMFSCGLTLALRISASLNKPSLLLAMFAMALLCPIGGALGVWFIPIVSVVWLDAIIAFGLGILIYICLFDLILPGFESSQTRLRFVCLLGFILVLLLQAWS